MNLRELKDFEEPPPHPGEILRHDFLEEIDQNQTELAEDLDVTPQYLGDVLNGRRKLSTKLSIKLSREFDVSIEFFLKLQRTRDVYEAFQELKGDGSDE